MSASPYPFEGPERREVFADRELHRIQEFMDVTSQIEDTIPNSIEVDFADDEPVLAAIERFKTYEMHAAPTFYVGEALQPYVPSPKNTVSFAPRVSRGGKRSFHGVFFGDLTISTDISVPVAVKPHKDRPLESCLNDYLKNEAIRKVGFHTPPGVGYIMAGDKAYSMSVLDETLTTLDSIDWSGFYPGMSQNPGMQEMWREISQQAAFLHSRGNLSHGDFAARNIATSAEGGVFLIDWERARLDMRLPRDAEVSYNSSYIDLSSLVESMCLPAVPLQPGFEKTGIGIFYDKSGDWWGAFREIFFDAYCEIRRLEVDHRLELDRRKGRKYHEHEVEEEIGRLAIDLKDTIEMVRATCESVRH